MPLSSAIALTLMPGLPTAAVAGQAAIAGQCDDLLQQDKSQQNTADEGSVKGDLKAGSECATVDDKQSLEEERGGSRKAKKHGQSRGPNDRRRAVEEITGNDQEQPVGSTHS